MKKPAIFKGFSIFFVMILSFGSLLLFQCTEFFPVDLKTYVSGEVYFFSGLRQNPQLIPFAGIEVSLHNVDDLRNVKDYVTHSDETGAFAFGNIENVDSWVDFGTYYLTYRVVISPDEFEYYEYSTRITISQLTLLEDMDNTSLSLDPVILLPKATMNESLDERFMIVLSWDQTVADLDFHLSYGTGENGVLPFAPTERSHIHSDPNNGTITGTSSSTGEIFNSDPSGYASTGEVQPPEIMVIRSFEFEQNLLVNTTPNYALLSVYAYDDRNSPNGTRLSQSNASVFIYDEHGIRERFYIGEGVGGNTWRVCTIDQQFFIYPCGNAVGLNGQPLECGSYIPLTDYSDADYNTSF